MDTKALLAIGVIGAAAVFAFSGIAKAKPKKSSGGGGGGGGRGGGGVAPKPKDDGKRSEEELSELLPEEYRDAEIVDVLKDLQARADGSNDFEEVHYLLGEFDAWSGLLDQKQPSTVDPLRAAIEGRLHTLARKKYNELMGLGASSSVVGALLAYADKFAAIGPDWYDEANNLNTKAAQMQERLERTRDAAAIRAQCKAAAQQMVRDGVDDATITAFLQECEAQARAVEHG